MVLLTTKSRWRSGNFCLRILWYTCILMIPDLATKLSYNLETKHGLWWLDCQSFRNHVSMTCYTLTRSDLMEDGWTTKQTSKKNLITRGYTPLYKQPFFQRFSRVFLDKKIPIIEFPYSRCHSKREMVLCFFGRPWLGKVQLVSWWLSHPIEKYWSSWIMSPLSRWEQTKWNNNQVKMHVFRWPFLQAQFDKSMWRLQKSGSSRSQSQIPGNFELPTMNYRFSAW